MKSVAFVFAVLFATFAFAERELSLGKYADETRACVVAKIREALDGKGAAVSGTVTYAANGTFFLQRESDGLKVHASGKLPAVKTDHAQKQPLHLASSLYSSFLRSR